MMRKSILVVDDDFQIREIFSQMLQALDYRCQCASNGLEAYDLSFAF